MIIFINFYYRRKKLTEFNQKVKTLLKLKTELELYEVAINGCLERIERDIENFAPDSLSNFQKVTLENIELDEVIRGTAETVETIFLKSRNLLTKFPLDTIAQERLETLGVNFDIDVGVVVELENSKREIN